MSDEIESGDLVIYPDGEIFLAIEWPSFGDCFFGIYLHKQKNGNYKFHDHADESYKTCEIGEVIKFKGKITIEQS